MLKSPFDIVIVFSITAVIVLTMGFGITSIESLGASTGNTTFFSGIEADVLNSTGLKGTADEATDVIDPSDDPLTAEASEEGIITQGLQSLRSVGSTYKAVENVMKEGTAELGIDSIYWQIASFTLIIIIFVIIYTWARGR